MYYSKLIIGYTIKQQLLDLFPTFKLVLFSYIPVYLIGVLTEFSPIMTLTAQVFTAAIMLILFAELFKNKEYLLIKEMFKKNK